MIQSKPGPWAGTQMDQLGAGCLSYTQLHNYPHSKEEQCRGLSLAGSAFHLLLKEAL